MAKIAKTLESVLETLKTKACTWYKECSFCYSTRKAAPGSRDDDYSICCSILVDGYDLNYTVRMCYAEQPRGRKFRYLVQSSVYGVVCEKTTNDFKNAVAFYEKLLKAACVRITGRDEDRPAAVRMAAKFASDDALDHCVDENDNVDYRETA